MSHKGDKQPFKGTQSKSPENAKDNSGEAEKTQLHIAEFGRPHMARFIENSLAFIWVETKNIPFSFFFFQFKCCWWENKTNLKERQEALSLG